MPLPIEPVSREDETNLRVMRERINELIEAFNIHCHMTIDSYTETIGNYDNGFYSSGPRIRNDRESS